MLNFDGHVDANANVKCEYTFTSRGLILTSCKIIYFNSHEIYSEHFGQKTGFKPIKYLSEPPII